MVHTPSAPAMLGAWERGLGEGPVERGLTLLELACPDDGAEALAALGVGERDRRLLALREALFGAQVTGLVACAACGERVELEFAAADVRALPVADPAPLPLPHGEGELRLRVPDSRDLQAAAAAGPGAATVLLERCLVPAAAPSGAAPAPRADGFPPELVAEAGRRLAEADPLLDVRFALTCPSCGHAWSAPFDVVPFLWTELDAWAGRAFAGVHVLASAYGWSEAEILGLSPARREAYLRMAGG
ncbi:MAG TPA: hypothetical protein VGD01_11660 [Candidatus Elarobacter sp.]|jgi:hypothetical protein